MRAVIRLVCPVDETHGALLPLAGNSRWGFYCPHSFHDGRLSGHPKGPATKVRAFFTTAEVERGSIEATP